jgi:hypothetical protein
MVNTSPVFTDEQTIRLLAASDAELLGVQTDAQSYAALAFAFAEFYGLAQSPEMEGDALLVRLVRIYTDYKTRGQKKAGSLLAKALATTGGTGVCDRVNYCNNKARLKALFDFADSPEGQALLAKGAEAAMQSEYAKDIELLNEILGGAAETIRIALGELFEVAADFVIPGAFVFMIVKYGLDELCMCCDECDGAGSVGSGTCRKCRGVGHFRAL